MGKNNDGHELKPGDIMPEGSIYAGISPTTKKRFYAAAQDYSRNTTGAWAINAAANEPDARVPTIDELQALYRLRNKGAFRGTFNTVNRHPRRGFLFLQQPMTEMQPTQNRAKFRDLIPKGRKDNSNAYVSSTPAYRGNDSIKLGVDFGSALCRTEPVFSGGLSARFVKDTTGAFAP